jgi:pilus assembly protein CpaF
VDAVRTLEGEVRELIRRSGLDPARDGAEVRRLVREAVADYNERSLFGGMPVFTDADAASRAAWDTVAASPAGVCRPTKWSIELARPRMRRVAS